MKVSPRLFCLWSFLDKKLESALQQNYITRHLCLFVYFSLISHNFQLGANDESLHFCFKSTEQVGNFTSRSIRPLCVDVSKVHILFYHRSKRGLQKPFVLVHSAYFTILKTESGLFDEFVPRDISQATSSLSFLT